ncbi:MAG TPA: GNAT family N-acetyltransferase [Chloroflexota bacterium]|nr:GNAT family N-acetyltransferase [Chloroflexota bacterium]
MISRCEPADLPALARLMAASALLQRYGVTFEGALAALTSGLTNGDLILTSRQGDDLSGFAWVSFGPRILNGAAYLRLLLVGAPGAGEGTRLLLAVEDAARAAANHLYLLATTDNLGARRFYARHGFRHVGDLPGLVVPELDEALYHKALRLPGERR